MSCQVTLRQFNSMKTALIAALLVAASLVFPINGVAQTATEFNDRGVAKWRKGDLDGAIADYNRAVELNPKDTAAYYNRGVAKQTRGDLDGAFADYNRTLELDPKYAVAYNNRSAAKQAKGDLSLDDRVAASQQRITSQMKDLSQIARSLSGREATLVVQIVAGTPFCEIDCLRKLLLIRSFVHNEDDKKKIDVEISDQIDFLAQAADVEIEDIPQKTPVLQDQAAIQAANKLKDELRELKKLPKPVP